MTILEEAATLVAGNRQDDYGHPFDNFSDVARMWNVQLRKKLKYDISAEDAALMLIAVKLCRCVNAVKDDSLVDIAGYAQVVKMIQLERARRESVKT